MKSSRSLATLIEGITSPSLSCFAGGGKLEGLCPSSSHILVNQVYFSSQCFSFLTHRHRSMYSATWYQGIPYKVGFQVEICSCLQDRLSPLMSGTLFLGKVYFLDGFPQDQFFQRISSLLLQLIYSNISQTGPCPHCCLSY